MNRGYSTLISEQFHGDLRNTTRIRSLAATLSSQIGSLIRHYMGPEPFIVAGVIITIVAIAACITLEVVLVYQAWGEWIDCLEHS